MKKIKLYGRVRLGEGKLFFVTALLEEKILINDKVVKIIINNQVIKIDSRINRLIISFGRKKIDSLEIEKGHKGLISMDVEFDDLNILPEVVKDWEINNSNEVYLVIDN